MTNTVQVGRVTETNVYPFKGMRGLSVDEIFLKSVSVVGDRRFALTEIGSIQVPTLVDTIKYPGLLKYSPYFVDPSNLKSSEVRVHTPEGKEYSADSTELIEEISKATGKTLAVIKLGRGAYHSMPVSLLSLGSVKEIEKNIGASIDIRRFRENVVIETVKGLPFEEDSWIGKLLSFGDTEEGAIIAVVKPDNRCATVDLDPESGNHNSSILKSVVKNHDKNLGVYCAIVKEGKIKTGDSIYLKTF
jgi:uncharacterized protein